MQDVTLIGIGIDLDLGKHSFHVHGQDRQSKADEADGFSAPSGAALIVARSKPPIRGRIELS